MNWRDYQVDVPSGKRGTWKVFKRTVTELDCTLFEMSPTQSLFGKLVGLPSRRPVPGVFTVLADGDSVVMSDTPAEVMEHREFIERAHGHVLIHGLGLGMCARAVCLKPEVSSVTVVERNPEVIQLVWNHVGEQPWSNKCRVILDDAFTWRPDRALHRGKVPECWDIAWHDIWYTISEGNLEQMVSLRKRFAPWVSGWQGCWAEDQCRTMSNALKAVRICKPKSEGIDPEQRYNLFWDVMVELGEEDRRANP